MPLIGSFTQRLPASVQDLLRSATDSIDPRRRAVRPEPDELSERVSPRGIVLAGPFAGMRLSLEQTWGGMSARLAGTYESEIADGLMAMVEASPHLVVDIGCAEGYYAVGLARCLPHATIVAFDIEPRARRTTKVNADLNGVANLRILGRATTSRLRKVVVAEALIVCDCEGLEIELLDPAVLPVLSSCDICVELHEFTMPGLTARLLARFTSSHDVSLITARQTGNETPEHLHHLSPSERARALDEGRPTNPPIQWALMRSRHSGLY